MSLVRVGCHGESATALHGSYVKMTTVQTHMLWKSHTASHQELLEKTPSPPLPGQNPCLLPPCTCGEILQDAALGHDTAALVSDQRSSV